MFFFLLEKKITHTNTQVKHTRERKKYNQMSGIRTITTNIYICIYSSENEIFRFRFRIRRNAAKTHTHTRAVTIMDLKRDYMLYS